MRLPAQRGPNEAPVSAGLRVEQLIAALQRKAIPLPYEAAAFLVLEASERAAAEPVLLSPAELRISDTGELVMPPRASGPPPSTRDVCRGLANLLGELLVCSAQSVPPMLLRLVESSASDGPASAAQLRDELGATLVPLNRAAMRRVLARLVREAKRAAEEGRPRMSVHPQPGDAAHELDEVLGRRRQSGAHERTRCVVQGRNPETMNSTSCSDRARSRSTATSTPLGTIDQNHWAHRRPPVSTRRSRRVI